MNEMKLRHCPFCGGAANIIVKRVDVESAVRVRCTNCKAATRFVLINSPIGDDETTRYSRQQATIKSINLWNGRVNDDIEK